MLKTLAFVVVISLTIHYHYVLGQFGSNRGPIYYTYPNPYCQRNVVPHYPIREDWLLGKWQVLIEYQSSQRYLTKCKQIEIRKPFMSLLSYNYETTIRTVISRETYADNHTDTHTILAQHQGPAIEGRYILDKTDGLFNQSAGRKTHASALVFVGFTGASAVTKRPLIDPYDSALYVVCSHSATIQDYGGSFISEVGIMSKSGIVDDEYLIHYKKLLDEDEIINTTLFRPVVQEGCSL